MSDTSVVHEVKREVELVSSGMEERRSACEADCVRYTELFPDANTAQDLVLARWKLYNLELGAIQARLNVLVERVNEATRAAL